MNNLTPITQTKLIGLNKYLTELMKFDYNENLPTKIMFSGQKGLGKSTLALHFVNYVLSKDENFKYDLDNCEINIKNDSYITILNQSNPNFTLIDLDDEKKFIDINQIRLLINDLNKSSFNEKPRFVLIDNIEYLNKNSVNALLKILEEPNQNIHFILINNNKTVLSTLTSRCINFKIWMSNNECIETANKLLNFKIKDYVNNDFINYYSTPGNIYNLINFAKNNDYNLNDLNLIKFLKLLIKNNHFKKDNKLSYIFFDLIEFYFRKLDSSISVRPYNKYTYFLNRISNTKKYNLDDDSLFNEFEEEFLNV